MSKLDYRYMVYNTSKKEYQFTRICEKTKREAKKMLYRFIGKDAYKWRFEIRKVSSEYANKIRNAENLKHRIKNIKKYIPNLSEYEINEIINENNRRSEKSGQDR